MEIEERNRVNRLIRQLEEAESLTAGEPEGMLLEILRSLLRADGYCVESYALPDYPDLDYLAQRDNGDERAPSRIAIDFKYYHRTSNISVHAVEGFLRSRAIPGINRLMLISNVPHARQAVAEAERNNPFGVQLLDMDDLRAWVARQELETNLDGLSIGGMLRALSRVFARRIAVDPNAIDQLEWRDVERLLAEVFDGLGFEVTLTSAAKDGGKDVVLECTCKGVRSGFIVEVKHWRSGKTVGHGCVTDFLKVIVREKRSGGLFLSTYGFSDTAFEALSQVDRQRLRFGDREKMLALCTTYLKMESGLWTSEQPLPEILFERTS